MRLHRSPTSMPYATTTGGVALSPITSDESQPGAAQSYNHTARMTLSPNAKNAPNRATLVGHYVHHARQPTGYASVDLTGDAIPQTNELTYAKDAAHKRAGSQEGELQGAQRVQPTQARGSFATQAYREFLASATASAVTSAASSAAPSRQSSRSNSGFSSQAISGQSSRTASPMSKREEREDGQVYSYQPTHNHALSTGASLPLAQYLETQFHPAPQAITTTTTTVTQQVSTLSFGNMVLKKSNSQDSLDDEDGGVSHERPQPKLRPNHFTFCEQDIMKSFMRAAERDRARAEREERAREAQQRVELEQEHERRKQQQREQAARDLAYQAQAARYETVGETLSSDSSPDASGPSRRRRRFLPVPAHFKFSTHDVTKSAAKPSQRQNIGHWTTFPRSSTVMLPAEQLRGWIRSMIQEHQQEMQRKMQQQQLQRAEQRKQLNSAPSSPASGNANVRPLVAQAPLGASTSRLPGRTASVQRRASLPAVYDGVSGKLAAGVNIPIRATAAGAGHTRSTSYSHAGQHALARMPVDRAALLAGNEKAQLSGSARRASLDASQHRAGTVSGGFERAVSLQSLAGHNNATAQKPLVAHRASLPVGSVAQATAAAIDAAARRAQVLQARHGQVHQRQGSLDLGLHASSASAPGSIAPSPHRSAALAAAQQNGLRAVKSTHVSPTRPDQRRLVSAGSNGLAAQYAPQPPVVRKASLGGETKVASATNSPAMQGRSLGNGDASWQVAYEKSLNDVYTSSNGVNHVAQQQQQNGFQKPTSQLYKDVPSSGYGQRIR